MKRLIDLLITVSYGFIAGLGVYLMKSIEYIPKGGWAELGILLLGFFMGVFGTTGFVKHISQVKD